MSDNAGMRAFPRLSLKTVIVGVAVLCLMLVLNFGPHKRTGIVVRDPDGSTHISYGYKGNFGWPWTLRGHHPRAFISDEVEAMAADAVVAAIAVIGAMAIAEKWLSLGRSRKHLS